MRIGFVGLGDMGSRIVLRLIAAGHSVTGWNRTQQKANDLVNRGMIWAETPRAAASGCEVCFSIVTDGAAVRAVALGPDGIIAGLGPDSIYLDMSTIDPKVTREVAALFGDAGRTMLDAPISGSPITLDLGSASIMVGGDRASFEGIEPVLQAIGSRVTYIGESGAATLMKIAVNLTLIVEMVAFCESIALAERGGVRREVAVDAMLKSVVASPVMGYRGPFILEGSMPDKPLADVTLQQKDMVLALEVARRQGSPAPLGAVANELLNACRGLGLDQRDFVTVFDVYRMLGGMT